MNSREISDDQLGARVYHTKQAIALIAARLRVMHKTRKSHGKPGIYESGKKEIMV